MIINSHEPLTKFNQWLANHYLRELLPFTNHQPSTNHQCWRQREVQRAQDGATRAKGRHFHGNWNVRTLLRSSKTRCWRCSKMCLMSWVVIRAGTILFTFVYLRDSGGKGSTDWQRSKRSHIEEESVQLSSSKAALEEEVCCQGDRWGSKIASVHSVHSLFWFSDWISLLFEHFWTWSIELTRLRPAQEILSIRIS